MLNKVILQGNMGRIPKIKKTQDGREIAEFFLATSVYWKACPREGGEPMWLKQTDWHKVTVFTESTVQWAKEKLKQGDALYIEGKLSYSYWKDKFGQYRSTPHIIISGPEGHIEYLRSKKSETEKSSSYSFREETISPPEYQDANDPVLKTADGSKDVGDQCSVPRPELPIYSA